MLPTLAVLRSFEAAAKHQSFTSAAKELHVSQAVISRQVRDLEKTLGLQLFRKQGRGVILTIAGTALAQDLHHGLERLRDIILKAQGSRPAGQALSIAVLPTFSSRWLAPRLPRFRAACPEANLVIRSRSEPFDLVREGFDVAIHFGTQEWIGGKHTTLCPEAPVAVASPEMIEEFEIRSAEDATRLPLLHLISRRNAWPAYFEFLGLDPSPANRGDFFDQFSAIIAAAIANFGAAIVPSYLVEAELAQGTLVPFGRPDPGAGMYYAVTPIGVENDLAHEFCNWIRREAKLSAKMRSALN